MTVDPLSEKFPFQSHYVFSANRVIDGRELEGLEVLLLHGDVRGSLLLTVSGSAGIYLDFKNNDIGVFGSVGGGAGLAAGVSASVGATYYPTAGMEDIKGWGLSYVGSITPGLKYSGSIQRTIDAEKYNLDKTGASVNVGIGAEIVLAMEGSHTWATSGKPLAKLIYNMMDKNDQQKIMNILDNNLKENQNKLLDLTKQYGNLEKMKSGIKDEDKLKEINNQQSEIQEEKEKTSRIVKMIDEFKRDLNNE